MEKIKSEYPYDPHPQKFVPFSPEDIKFFGKGASSCDPGIINLVKRLNEAGFHTLGSCSGLTADHRKQPTHSYLWIAKTDEETARKVAKAGEDADLLVLYHGGIAFHMGSVKEYEMMEIRSPRRPKTDEEIHQAWQKFEKSLLSK